MKKFNEIKRLAREGGYPLELVTTNNVEETFYFRLKGLEERARVGLKGAIIIGIEEEGFISIFHDPYKISIAWKDRPEFSFLEPLLINREYKMGKHHNKIKAFKQYTKKFQST